jgi:hypothetical protein
MHCKHSPVGILGKFAWLIVSLAAIFIGAAAFNVYDFYGMPFYTAHKQIIAGIIGVAGLLSLLGLLTAGYRCMNGTCADCMPHHHGR